jgi:excisionase family DNA binding protein
MLTLTLTGAEGMLSIKEVADRLDVSVMTVRRLVWKGDLPAFKIGGRLKFDPEAVEYYLKEQAYQPKVKSAGDKPEAPR